MEEDGFTLVKNKKKKRARKDKKGYFPSQCNDNFAIRIEEYVKDVAVTDAEFISNLCSSLCSVREVVCYGIGQIASCRLAQLQFAVLVLIVRQLDIKICYVQDPILTPAEHAVIESYGLAVLPTNEQCRRTVTGPTLFYMIHCSRMMYNNLLQANWSNIELVTLLGNTLDGYSITYTASQMNKQSPHISLALPHSTSQDIPAFSSDGNAFNNTKLTTFMHNKM